VTHTTLPACDDWRSTPVVWMYFSSY
jgi:hypothetical protein